MEVLIPDFRGDLQSLKIVMEARPDVLNDRVETVPRLYASVRPQAVYQRSIDLLRNAHRSDPSIPTKSGLMLGLGEQPEEVVQVLRDPLDAGRPASSPSASTFSRLLKHLLVERFVMPEEFEEWRKKALQMGFREVASGPFVRSSYHAQEAYQAVSSKPESSHLSAEASRGGTKGQSDKGTKQKNHYIPLCLCTFVPLSR